jgi:hypothetical protein
MDLSSRSCLESRYIGLEGIDTGRYFRNRRFYIILSHQISPPQTVDVPPDLGIGLLCIDFLISTSIRKDPFGSLDDSWGSKCGNLFTK